ncbi:Septin-6 [Entomophthora muscae]|uniref:Septin-6 n=1 Tax=Entomophthora muscae TaxID=34485 RepID=A0ACC2RK25_9FUNG|nr:Septin-6 [Entomophthora muscae]
MVLLITGPRWPALKWNLSDFNEDSKDEFFLINGHPIFTHEKELEHSSLSPDSSPEAHQDNNSHNQNPLNKDFDREHTTNTSKVVWDSSIVLSKYIETLVALLKLDLNSKRVLELGAGKGVVGIACAILGATVTLSDAPEAIPTLSEVVRLNKLNASISSKGCIERVVALDWISCSQGIFAEDLAHSPFDFIVASDVIWVDWLVEPLIKTLAGFMNQTTIAYLAYQQRGARCHPLFLKSMQKNGLKYNIIPFQDLHPQYQLGDTIAVYRLEKDSIV